MGGTHARTPTPKPTPKRIRCMRSTYTANEFRSKQRNVEDGFAQVAEELAQRLGKLGNVDLWKSIVDKMGVYATLFWIRDLFCSRQHRRCLDAKHISNRDLWHHFGERVWMVYKL